MTTTDDLTPDTDELLQEEHTPAPLTPVPVVVQGPVRVAELPSVGLVLDQVDVDNATPQKVWGKDPRRKRLTLIASGGAIRLATSQAACKPGSGAILPTGVPLPITASNEVWVMASTAAATTVSYIVEQWADGNR